MPIVTQTEYRKLIRRQKRFEKDLSLLKEVVRREAEEWINPVMLKRWERISRDLDQGKGRRFSSLGEMRRRLKNL